MLCCLDVKKDLLQGSPNQVKWATSSPWCQWNRPISVKKRSFSRPVSLFKFVFFSPIIILFLQYSHKRELPCSWNLTHTVWCSIFYSKLINCILFKIIVQHVRFVKCRGTCSSGERNVKIWVDFQKSPRFSLTSPLSHEREKSSRPDFTMCGEPCSCDSSLWVTSQIVGFPKLIFERQICLVNKAQFCICRIVFFLCRMYYFCISRIQIILVKFMNLWLSSRAKVSDKNC